MKGIGDSSAFMKLGLMAVIGIAWVIAMVAGDGRSIAQNDTEAEEGFTISEDFNDIVLNNSGYKKDRRGPVKLSHTKHALEYGVSCWDCHHEYTDDKINTWSPLSDTYACIECHDPLEVQDNAMRLQTAYHMNCKGCHKELAVKHEKTGAYRKCLKCHEKKNS